MNGNRPPMNRRGPTRQSKTRRQRCVATASPIITSKRNFSDDPPNTPRISGKLDVGSDGSPMAGRGLVSQVSAEEQSSSPNERLRVAVVGLNGRGSLTWAVLCRERIVRSSPFAMPTNWSGRTRESPWSRRRPARSRASMPTSENCLKTRASTSSRLPHPTTGIRWAPFWAIQEGKDVYVEKPVSHNVSEGRGVVDAAAKAWQDLPDWHAKPFERRHSPAHGVPAWGRNRRGEARPRAVLQATRIDRSAGNLPGFLRASITTCGAVRRRRAR